MIPRGPIRAIRRWAAQIDRATYALRTRNDRGVRLDRALGLELYVPESVLSPVLFRTGILLADAVARDLPAGARVLDLGCGSGIVALFAARAGAKVIAADVNPAAVRAAQVGAMLNRVEVDVRLGDLFEPVRGLRFDRVAFNPPFFERAQGGPLSLALADAPGLPTYARFCEQLAEHLAPGGAAYVAGSSNGALGRMRALEAAAHLTRRPLVQRERISERLVIDVLEAAC